LSETIRFGVSIDQDLLENYDRLIAERGYATRSEALRDLIRDALIQQKIETQSEIHALGNGAASAQFSSTDFVRHAFARQPRRLSGNHRSARRGRGNRRVGKRAFELKRHQKRQAVFDLAVVSYYKFKIIQGNLKPIVQFKRIISVRKCY
jgi:Arc/MetJ-type ribon-helix-helix transcriptional regulator